MFGTILKFIAEDKMMQDITLFCQLTKISQEEFYDYLFTLEKELMIKKCFIHQPNDKKALLGYVLTYKGNKHLDI